MNYNVYDLNFKNKQGYSKKNSSKKTKKYKIILCSAIVSLILIIGITFSTSGSQICYKEKLIISGDTLWDIALEEKDTNTYFANKDIRAIMYEIKELNNLNNSNITSGEKLLIPMNI